MNLLNYGCVHRSQPLSHALFLMQIQQKLILLLILHRVRDVLAQPIHRFRDPPAEMLDSHFSQEQTCAAHAGVAMHGDAPALLCMLQCPAHRRLKRLSLLRHREILDGEIHPLDAQLRQRFTRVTDGF